jgi:hypothetical protein
MSAFHHSLIVEEFQKHDGKLSAGQLARAVGFGWRQDIHEMRRARYLIVEDPADLFHLDLEELPDVGRAAVEGPPCADGDAAGPEAHPAGFPAKDIDSSSPGTDRDPQVEGETPLPLDIEERRPASPYDPSVEAA